MSTTSSEVHVARINTPVHISLTAAALSSSSSHRSTSDQASTTFSRFESFPTIHPSVRHGSLTLIVHPPDSETSSGTQSKAVVGHERHSWSGFPGLSREPGFSGDPGFSRDPGHSGDPEGINPGGVLVNPGRRGRDAPVLPGLPGYTELIEPRRPPPYNPGFLSPTGCHRWTSNAVGRRPASVSDCQRPPAPPRLWSSTVHGRGLLPSLSLIHSQPQPQTQRVMNDDDNDNDDDVFLTERPTTLGTSLRANAAQNAMPMRVDM